MRRKVLAFDFGASSGRAVLGVYEDGRLSMEEMYRFSNDPVMVNGTFYWDALRLFYEIKQGIQRCVNSGNADIDSIGIDTWGVDFGLIDKYGKLVENPVHYRDSRTEGMMEEVCALAGKDNIYSRTGIEFIDINTVNHLYSLKKNRPEVLQRADRLLFTPDLFAYMLTGKMNVEYTIASTSQLLNASTRDWDDDIISKLGFDRSLFGRVNPPGTVVGKLLPDIAEELGIGQVDVISVAGHDTASAVAAAPISADESGCFISCGTWSLLGAELKEPLINAESFKQNFSNEGGFGGTIRFLKNIPGLWILQELRRQWVRQGDNVSFKDIDRMLETETSAEVFIDPDYAPFGKPGSMGQKIDEFLTRTGQQVPDSKGRYALCILESLAMTYRYYIENLEKLLGRRIDVIHIIGGGVKDVNLCRFTAEVTGRKVTAGPVEATALGNIAVQLIAGGAIDNINEARKLTSDYKTYMPDRTAEWQVKYDKYISLKGALE